jgi:hypothetical protein
MMVPLTITASIPSASAPAGPDLPEDRKLGTRLRAIRSVALLESRIFGLLFARSTPAVQTDRYVVTAL